MAIYDERLEPAVALRAQLLERHGLRCKWIVFGGSGRCPYRADQDAGFAGRYCRRHANHARDKWANIEVGQTATSSRATRSSAAGRKIQSVVSPR